MSPQSPAQSAGGRVEQQDRRVPGLMPIPLGTRGQQRAIGANDHALDGADRPVQPLDQGTAGPWAAGPIVPDEIMLVGPRAGDQQGLAR